MLYTKWMEELDQMDTPAVKERRYREYWYMLEISGTFATFKPKIWKLNLIYTIGILTNLTYFFICHTVTVFKVEDIAIAGQSINYAAVILICIVTVVVGNAERGCMIGMFETCISGFYDYEDEEALPENAQEFRKLIELAKKFAKLAVSGYMLMIAASVLLADQVDALFNYEAVTSNVTSVNGVYQNFPVKMWSFVPIETDLQWALMLVYLAFDAAELALITASAALMLTFFGLELILQQNILRNACLKMDTRANTLYEKRYGRRPPREPLERPKDQALMKCYEYCLRQVVEHHRVLLGFTEKYITMVNWPAGIVVCNASISIAMSTIIFLQAHTGRTVTGNGTGVQLIRVVLAIKEPRVKTWSTKKEGENLVTATEKGGGKPSMLVTSILMLFGAIGCVLLMCELGQVIKNLSEDIFDAIYCFEWMDCAKPMLKDVIIMKHLLSRPIVLMAGPLTALDRDTFNTIMSTSYSYINVLRARIEGK